MKISTTNDVAGHSVAETIGIARGSTVRTRNVGNDILAAFKNLVGGEVAEYTRLQADAREQALQRMIEDAKNLGASCNLFYFNHKIRINNRYRTWLHISMKIKVYTI